MIRAIPAMARANRSFMERVTGHLVESGVTWFLDIGSGVPTSPNLHEIARRIDPSVRVVRSRRRTAGAGRGAARDLASRHAPDGPHEACYYAGLARKN